jgi:hypothetical protein
MNLQQAKQIAVVVAFIALILVNFLGTPFSGTVQPTVEEVFQDTLNVLINPAPLAIVMIWFFAIFPGLGAFSIFQARRDQRNNPRLHVIRDVAIVNFALGSVWVLATQSRNFVLVNVAAWGLFLTALVVVIIMRRPGRATTSKGEYWCVLVPFSIYLAWLSVANIVSVAGLLVEVGWDGFGIGAAGWTVIMMAVAAALAGAFLILERDVPFALVVIYALTAIAFAQSQMEVIKLAWLVLATILAIACVVTLVRRPSPSQVQRSSA